ncbi:histidine utilization repressor [Pseudomonas matsuisoli]|uniref:Histidine utilization repressor n=1 Tax=Pseudomonas matsuisoli TaxID=1515666 RepID=A0A917PU30_9PSED|nr:histidine utilization repressor [Pseudomonas matsuisoli]GGJ92037.1 histidine utilization repressor [Pseudomonas matsuisoli]
MPRASHLSSPSHASSAAAGPAPLYERVKQMILHHVRSGEWPTHHRVPSESELVGQLGFSRMTINRALRELTADGVLVRMQGVGTFVAEQKGQAALVEVHNIAEEIASRGHVHRLDIITLGEEIASSERAAALDVKPGQRVFHSLIVHYENDVAVQIEDRFVNPLLAPDYLAQDFHAETPFVYLNRVAPLSAGEHGVEAVLPSVAEARLLQIKRQEPCLLIRRRTWSGPRLVTSARLLYPGSRYRLEGRFGG